MNWLPSSLDAKSQLKKKWPGPGDDDNHVGGFNDLVTFQTCKKSW